MLAVRACADDSESNRPDRQDRRRGLRDCGARQVESDSLPLQSRLRGPGRRERRGGGAIRRGSDLAARPSLRDCGIRLLLDRLGDRGCAQGPDRAARFLREENRKPKRVIAWGGSLGGIITAGLVQLHPDRFAGAMPLCGVLAGGIATWNAELDAAYAFKALLAPGSALQLVHIADPVANWQLASQVL